MWGSEKSIFLGSLQDSAKKHTIHPGHDYQVQTCSMVCLFFGLASYLNSFLKNKFLLKNSKLIF